jgi:hypothetical protein
MDMMDILGGKDDLKTKQSVGELMADKKKKLAAALAAVSLYLQEEETKAYEQQTSLTENKGGVFSAWGQSGYQEMMAMRRLIQLRAFTRF